MKHLRLFGVGMAFISLVLLVGLFVSTPKAYATDIPDLNSLGGGDTAKNKILSATTLTVNNQGSIDVAVNVPDNIFKNVTTGTYSFHDAFSGSYIDTNITDGTHQWESKRIKIKEYGTNSGLYASGYIVSKKSVPAANASKQELDAWLSQVQLFFRIYLDDSGVASTDAYSFFVDIINDGDCNYGWHQNSCSFGLGDDFGSNEQAFTDSDVKGLTPLTFKNPDNIKIGYAYINDQIVTVDGKKTYIFSSDPAGTIKNYYQQKDGGDVIFSTPSWNGMTQDQISTLFNCASCTKTLDVSLGDANKSTIIRVAQANSPAATNVAAQSGTGDTNIDISCDWDILNPLTWFLCPLIEGGAQVITKLDAEINNRLTIRVDAGSNFDESQGNGKGLYTAWSAMRTIALSLLVLIALVMVISQAISIGPFDAYTVKKVLPRIVIAVIAITLSWQLTKFLIGISNDFGQGIGTIMSRPFANIGSNPRVDVSGGTNNAIGTIGTIAGLFSGLDLLAVGSFLLVGIAAVFIALIVIAFRSILITLLVIMAPVGLIAWILPNTQKGWKIWKDNFTAALVSFPIIIAFITSGRIFSKITSNSESGLFSNIIVFIAYFGPYFALPLAFRLAGGAIASIGGIANDRGKGFFDRNKKFRGNRIAQNKAKEAGFSRFSDRNALGRGANTLLGGGRAIGRKPSILTHGREGMLAARQTGRANFGAENLKNDATFQAHGNDDNFLLALANERLAEDKIKEDEVKLARAKSTGNIQDGIEAQRSIDARKKGLAAARQVGSRKQASTRLAAVNALAKTGYQLSAGQKGYTQLSDTIQDIVGNDRGAYAAAMDESQYHLKNAQRFDLAGINHGAGYDSSTGLSKASLYELANAKKESIQAMMESIPLAAPAATWSPDQQSAAAVTYMELEAMKPNAKGAVAKEIDSQMAALQNAGLGSYMNTGTGRIDPSTGGLVTIQKRINYDTSNINHTSGPNAFSAEESARGWRIENKPETNADIASAKARTYRQPDPNNIT